jgi:hypothetical protein
VVTGGEQVVKQKKEQGRERIKGRNKGQKKMNKAKGPGWTGCKEKRMQRDPIMWDLCWYEDDLCWVAMIDLV